MIAGVQEQRIEEAGLKILRMDWKDRLDRRHSALRQKFDPLALFTEELRVLMLYEIGLMCQDDPLYAKHQAAKDKARFRFVPDEDDEKFPWFDADWEPEDLSRCEICGRP